MKLKLIAVLALAALPLRAQLPSITWTQRTVTFAAGNVDNFNISGAKIGSWGDAYTDPVSSQVIIPMISTVFSGNIYSDAWAAYCPPGLSCTADVITEMNRTATSFTGTECSVADATHWGNVHTYRGGQLMDTTRSIQILVGGANGNCAGGTGVNAAPRSQMYHWTLNANPASDTGVTQDTPAHLPSELQELHSQYDSTADVYINFLGGPPNGNLSTNMYIYCPGTPVTAAQTAWGCTTNGDWQAIFPVNGGYTFASPTVTVTSGSISDIAVGDVLQFGTSNWTPGCEVSVPSCSGPSVAAIVSSISGSTFNVTGANGTIPATGFWTLYPSGTAVDGSVSYIQAGTKIAFDANGGAHGRMLLFGGVNSPGGGTCSPGGGAPCPVGGTFAYDGQAHHWIHLAQATSAPTLPDTTGQYPFTQVPTAWDSANRRLWYRLNCPHSPNGSSCTGTTQTWMYSAANDTWSQIDTGAGPSASGIYMTYVGGGCHCLVALDITSQAPNAYIVWVGTISGTSQVTGQFRQLATWPSGHLKHVEGCGVLASLAAAGTANVSVGGISSANFVIQEMLYPGDQTGSTYSALGGIARTNEPFCTDIPISDAAAVTSVNTLAFTGTASVTNVNMATDGQDCTGVANTNFICVNTGAAKFQIRKANTNIIDGVTVGATTIVTPGIAATRGLILTGPDPTLAYPGNTTCAGGAGCNTQYSSSNDANSTCAIVSGTNGPVKVQVRCNGSLIDGTSHFYQHYTVYLKFFVNETYVLVDKALRNADFGAATGTFETATKQLKAWELRIPLATSPTTFTIPSFSSDSNCLSGICSGTIGGTSGAFLYQGFGTFLNGGNNFAGAGGWSADLGFTIQNNNVQVTSGTTTQFPVGVADCYNASGAGAAVGIINMGAEYPSSVECVGSDVRIGYYSVHNGIISATPTFPYIPWPQWVVTNAFIEFHSPAPATIKNDFLKAQLRLVGRPTVAYFNGTGVETYPIPTPTESDNLSVAAFNAAVPALGGLPTESNMCGNGSPPCMFDFNNQINPNYYATNYRVWGWGGTGAATDLDARRANSMNFFSRGQAGRLLDAELFYKWEMQMAWPHSDGASSTDSTVNSFLWSQKPGLNSLGRPAPSFYISANQGTWYNSITPGNTDPGWWDDLHFWWAGAINDYFYYPGNELLKEALVSVKAWYLNTGAIQNSVAGMNNGTVRGNAAQILSASQFYEYLASIGDTDAPTALANVKANFENWVLPDSCIKDGGGNLWPSGCTFPTLNAAANGTDSRGVSHVRGSMIGSSMRSSNIFYCNNMAWGGGGTGIRVDIPYFNSKMVDALITLQRIVGTSYSHYWDINDLLYGISQNSLGPSGYSDDGSTKWWVAANAAPSGISNSLFNGFRFAGAIDIAYQCSNNPTPSFNYPPNAPPDWDTESFTVPGGVWDFNSTAVGFGGPNPAGSRASIYGGFLGHVHNNGALTSDQIRKLYISMQGQGVANGQPTVDFYSYQFGALAHYLAITSPAELQDLPFSLTDLGSGNYRLTANVPTGTTQIRIKYSPKIIANSGGFSNITPKAINPTDGMLGYEPTVTQAFNLNPTTNATWFGATDATPSSFSTGSNIQFNITTTLGAGANANQFSLKALAPSGCTISPLTLGPFTVGQNSGFPTLVPSAGCNSSTFVIQSGTLPTGLMLSPAGVLSGAITAAGTFISTITYDTASIQYTILVTGIGTPSIPNNVTGVRVCPGCRL